MIYSKTNPVSEDAWIDRLLFAMEAILLPKWGAASGECKFFGRSEKIDDKDVFYTGGGMIDIYTDDRFKFISYVACEPDMRFDRGLRRITSKLVCQANLVELYPLISHRADAELRKDIEDILIMHTEPTEYKGFAIVDQSEITGMQPFHTVKFNFEIVI